MLTFVREFLFNHQQTGALLPSSRWLARAMTLAARQTTGPRRILEVGPGTGAFTREILQLLRPGDELHLVEINPAFARQLEQRLLATFRRQNSAIDVVLHQAPIEDAPLTGQFDFIICGLPFNNFPLPLVRRIFRRLIRLLKKGGELTFFEYAGVRFVRTPLVNEEGRRRLRQREATVQVLRRRHRGERDLVLTNVPPAFTFRLRA